MQDNAFLPLTYTRNWMDLRLGLYTIEERMKNGLFLQPDHKDFSCIQSPWDIISWNTAVLTKDIPIYGGGFQLNESSFDKLGDHTLIIHPTARIERCLFNTIDGPILIDEHAHLMDGSMLRGPVYVGKHAVIKMGTSLYAGANIGDHCTIGGEVKNAIFHSHSNKGHHGYIGDSYIGSWCNMGAGTSCSNVKNTAGEIRFWDIHQRTFKPAGVKAGILMGDFTKTAINTSFNSGSVTGVFANVFGQEGLTPKHIPSFSWGTSGGQIYQKEALEKEMTRWMAMKGNGPSIAEINMIHELYNQIKHT